MNVIVFGHSYLEPENQKNIESLNKICVVRCIVPRFGRVNLWKKNRNFHVNSKNKHLFDPYVPFYITKAQYILFSFTLGLSKIKPDIINIEYNPWSVQFIQLLIAKMFFSPQAAIVCTIKKNTYVNTPGFLSLIKNIAVKYTLGKVDYFIVVSQKAAEMLEKKLNVPRKKISVANQIGVDVNLFRPKKNVNLHPPFVVGYCGRLDEEKGVGDLVEAMRLLNNNLKSPIQLRLLGNGAYRRGLDEQLNEEAERLDWLKIFPSVPNDQVADFLNELDAFVLPSKILDDHEEHDAHALLEALATGIPCIGTTSGIIPEILQDKTGAIVQANNIYELSSGIKKLLSDNKLRQKFSENGRKKAEDCFSLDIVAAKKLIIFTKVKNERL